MKFYFQRVDITYGSFSVPENRANNYPVTEYRTVEAACSDGHHFGKGREFFVEDSHGKTVYSSKTGMVL